MNNWMDTPIWLNDARSAVGLFLDDERNPEDVFWIKYPSNITHWIIARNLKEFQFQIVNRSDIQYISFDHDLQDFGIETENTGYNCLKLLVDWCIMGNRQIPKCLFHTQNPVGLRNMESYYQNFLKFQEQNRRHK